MAGRRGDWKNVRSLFRVAIDPPSDLMIWSFLDEAKPPYHSNSDKVRAFRCLCWTNVATQTPCPSFSAAKITISELVLSSSVVGATHEVSVFLPKTRSCPIPSQILAPQRRGKGLVAWFGLPKIRAQTVDGCSLRSVEKAKEAAIATSHWLSTEPPSECSGDDGSELAHYGSSYGRMDLHTGRRHKSLDVNLTLDRSHNRHHAF